MYACSSTNRVNTYFVLLYCVYITTGEPDCQNGGFCTYGFCTCPPPYSGNKCDIGMLSLNLTFFPVYPVQIEVWRPFAPLVNSLSVCAW